MSILKVGEIVSTKKDLTNDYCLISYEPFIVDNNLVDRPIVKLLCNHCFFADNIKLSYIVTNKSSKNYVGQRTCPYCLKYGGYLPLIDNEEPMTEINLNLSRYNIKCWAIINNGKNKGKRCNCNADKKYWAFISTTYKNTENNLLTIVKKKKYYCGKHKKFGTNII